MAQAKPADGKSDLKWIIVLLFLVILALSGARNTGWETAGAGREDLGALTGALLSQGALMALLEFVGVALVAALVAALVIAMRERPGGTN
ncbi:MAG: hypothetical protein ACYDCK_00145 [Thermoplasmatota archaeon]